MKSSAGVTVSGESGEVHFGSVQKSQEGHYTCFAKNGVSPHAGATLILTVHAPAGLNPAPLSTLGDRVLVSPGRAPCGRDGDLCPRGVPHPVGPRGPPGQPRLPLPHHLHPQGRRGQARGPRSLPQSEPRPHPASLGRRRRGKRRCPPRPRSSSSSSFAPPPTTSCASSPSTPRARATPPSSPSPPPVAPPLPSPTAACLGCFN